jgi:ATP-dependent RNA circularization protein (DNA/RNA ligase family)
MKEYHKIQTVFKRDMENKGKTLLIGQWTLPEFEYLAGNQWVYTEKVDGTNIRIMFDGDKVSFCGKTDNAAIPAKLVERLRERFPDGEAFKSAFDCGGVCLYGEGYGAGIQKGGTYRPNQDFVLFDVKVGDWWLQREDVEDVAVKLDLDIVPVIGRGTLHECIDRVRGGLESMWGNFQAEGIVARPATELVSRGGHRIIAKIKCRDFSSM